jgi:hypothetical protein
VGRLLLRQGNLNVVAACSQTEQAALAIKSAIDAVLYIICFKVSFRILESSEESQSIWSFRNYALDGHDHASETVPPTLVEIAIFPWPMTT